MSQLNPVILWRMRFQVRYVHVTKFNQHSSGLISTSILVAAIVAPVGFCVVVTIGVVLCVVKFIRRRNKPDNDMETELETSILEGDLTGVEVGTLISSGTSPFGRTY